MIRTRRAAKIARRYAHVLIDWRADVARGARIGRSAACVDLPKRYRLDPEWVHRHVFEWDVHRQATMFAKQLDDTPHITARMRFRRGPDGKYELIG
jgi:hypothetical protein